MATLKNFLLDVTGLGKLLAEVFDAGSLLIKLDLSRKVLLVQGTDLSVNLLPSRER